MQNKPLLTCVVTGFALIVCGLLTIPQTVHAGVWDRLKEATEGLIKQDPDGTTDSSEQSAAGASVGGGCESMKAPVVGDWVEYRIVKQGESEMQMRQAVVGSEARAGQEMHWVEMAMTDQGRGETTILKILMPGYPYRPGEMEDMVMKTGDEPAMHVGPMMIMVRGIINKNPGLSVAAQCQAMEYVGDESVSVPAGKFSTRHYRDASAGAELWVAPELAFGIVKSGDAEGHSMELMRYGEDAKTAIAETPKNMFQ